MALLDSNWTHKNRRMSPQGDKVRGLKAAAATSADRVENGWILKLSTDPIIAGVLLRFSQMSPFEML